jgi:hypothetical protein
VDRIESMDSKLVHQEYMYIFFTVLLLPHCLSGEKSCKNTPVSFAMLVWIQQCWEPSKRFVWNLMLVIFANIYWHIQISNKTGHRYSHHTWRMFQKSRKSADYTRNITFWYPLGFPGFFFCCSTRRHFFLCICHASCRSRAFPVCRSVLRKM